jgi:hypothetical protein
VRRQVRRRLDVDRYTTPSGKLEYFDFRELQHTISTKALWPAFESRFASKEALAAKFGQLATFGVDCGTAEP